MKFQLKNTTNPGYKPPATWEEFRDLDRPARIIAARFFVRMAAIRLHDYGLRLDEVINAFDGVPPWISHQLHEHKCEQKELRKEWVCFEEECNYRGIKAEFFKDLDQTTFLPDDKMARCPECDQCNCGNVEPAPSDDDVACDHTYERDGLRCDRCGKLRPGTKGFQSDGAVAEEPCDCEGAPCPVCQSMQVPENVLPIIENHRCKICETTFCATCCGIVEAQLIRAYDAILRCRC